MNQQSIKETFREDGYIFIKNLLTDNEVEHYKSLLINHEKTKNNKSWAEADGVAKNSSFWSLIYNDRLLSKLAQLTSNSLKYLQHSDIQVNIDSVGWHRDSSHGLFNVGAKSEDIGALRVAMYLQSESETKFRMGVIPGTHRNTSFFNVVEKSIWSFYRRITNKLPPLYFTLRPIWFDIDAGSCLIFDTRILHTGTKPTGPKYSVYLVFGEDNNPLCENHYDYIHEQRKDLGYQRCPPELTKILEEKDLLYFRTEHNVD